LESEVPLDDVAALRTLVPDLDRLLGAGNDPTAERDGAGETTDPADAGRPTDPGAGPNATAGSAEVAREAGDGDAAETLDPVSAQKKLLAAVESLFRRQKQPVVVLLEDLQWSGDESLALLARLQQIAGALPLLVVASYRDDEKPDLPETVPGAEALKLPRLSPQAIEELSASMLGRTGHQKEVLDLLVRETEGNVLFVVEVARALAEEAGRLDGISGAHLPRQISTGGIRRILRRRLERVPPHARPLLDAAAVAGRELDLRLVERLAERLIVETLAGGEEASGNAPTLSSWLRTGASVAVLEVQGEKWRFTHDKLRENLLEDLDRERRRELHRLVGESLLDLYGDAPEHLGAQAFHFTEAAAGGDPEVVETAVRRLVRAGGLAVDSCANQVALGYLQDGLRLLRTLPTTDDRLRLEMELQNELGAAYLMSKGHAAAEVRACFERSRNLCQQLGDDRGLLPVLLGLWRHHVVRGELATARELAEQFLELAEQEGDLPFVVLADSALGTSLMYQGETARSWSCFGRSIEMYEALPPAARRRAAQAFSYGQNPGVANLVYGACDLWCLGYPDQALERAREGLALADQLAHPFSRAFASVIAAWVHQFRREYQLAGERAQQAIEISQAQGFQLFLAVGSVLAGWSMAMQGQAEQGIGRISKTLDLLRASGSELLRPYFLALLAEACGRAGTLDHGLEAVHEALEIAERSGQGWWLPEIHRLHGELLLMRPEPDLESAGLRFETALGLAWKRNEKGLALRAALSLAQLRQQTAASDPVRPLREVYEQLEEGFGTADLQAAALVLSMGT
ncbi:MAG: hypothetical protein MI919_12315, partial [Holophagales bacterium]|nr:hypothetical protein [Holophagales bacterium]